MRTPAPLREYAPGFIPSLRPALSYSRLLEPKPASCIAAVTVAPRSSEALKRSIRRAPWYSRGVIPSAALNTRCR
jgi:hypothetical protein